MICDDDLYMTPFGALYYDTKLQLPKECTEYVFQHVSFDPNSRPSTNVSC